METMKTEMPDRFMRLPEVMEQVGYRRSAIYQLVQKGEFPAPCPLGARAVGWLQSEVSRWLAARVAARKAALTGGAK